MHDRHRPGGIVSRRAFLRTSTAAVGAGALLAPIGFRQAIAQGGGAAPAPRNARPGMTYRQLGRTRIAASRLVFGCGAALAGGGAERLIERALELGINLFDTGSAVVYRESERNLAPFLKAHRNEVWVISKAPLSVGRTPSEAVGVEDLRTAAGQWLSLLDQSLADLGTDHIDGYSLMAVSNPAVVRSEELRAAFEKAKAAGKVDFFGISTHANAANVLAAAADTGWYDYIMVAVTPAGWYDWDLKDLAKDTPPLVELRPLLDRARTAGIGLIAMKTGRWLAGRVAAEDSRSPFDTHYDEKLLAVPLNPFQRAYAFVLDHGLDVVNAHMPNLRQLEENVAAVAVGVHPAG